MVHMQKNEARSYLTPYTDINLKWFKNVNIRLETTRYIEEDISIKLKGPWSHKGLCELNPKGK